MIRRSACADWSASQAYAAYNYCSFDTYCPNPPNHAELSVYSVVAQESAADLSAGLEYFMFQFMINHSKTAGSGSCTGCSVPVCIVLDSIEWDSVGGFNTHVVSRPTAAGSNVVTWQGGRGTGDVAPCPAAVPTRPSTWGALKTLYR